MELNKEEKLLGHHYPPLNRTINTGFIDQSSKRDSLKNEVY